MEIVSPSVISSFVVCGIFMRRYPGGRLVSMILEVRVKKNTHYWRFDLYPSYD
jgi:hypothetical protein